MNVSTPKDMQAVALLLKSTLLKSGFRLTKLYGNRKSALTGIPIEDLSSVTVNLDRQQTEAQKSLGVVWDGQSDSIRFNVSEWQGKATRRNNLSYVASLSDPLGLVATVLLTTKRLLQELCRSKTDWDEELASEEIVARHHHRTTSNDSFSIKALKDTEARVLKLVQQDCFHIDLCRSNYSSLRQAIRSLKSDSIR
ncbi:uncharacterized protein DEA37_0002071 [Paragonimus westermani]|uniref:Uncharacterized protein n=1 Tax=Paragonimus westermani TaxID=34504 RepID=A0A5J4N530_9TREM|nr:uncharacterized protein DEA37_0002071 [Paragonimus westermani]